MFGVARFHDSINIESTSFYLSIIDFLVELEDMKEGIETSFIRHHKRKKLWILCLILYRYFLGENILEVLVG